jgi:hypothetical protein
MRTIPPFPVENVVEPALKFTSPPEPESPEPTDTYKAPPRPNVAEPDPIYKAPLFAFKL